LSILESSCHELRITHGLTLMTPSPRGWEAFPTPRILTHTRITWAFSPPAPQVPGVTPGSPLCPWCFGLPFWRGARQNLYHEQFVVRCGSNNETQTNISFQKVGLVHDHNMLTVICSLVGGLYDHTWQEKEILWILYSFKYSFKNSKNYEGDYYSQLKWDPYSELSPMSHSYQ
jgi:hypothetical protein